MEKVEKSGRQYNTVSMQWHRENYEKDFYYLSLRVNNEVEFHPAKG